MRVAFFGSSLFSVHVLEVLHKSSHQVVTVISQSDQPAGRHMQLRPTPLADFAAQLGMAVIKPERLRGNADLEVQLKESGTEALAVASYGKLIPRGILQLTSWPLNVHPSPLPLLRGPSPLRSAMLSGWHETAVCIMRMTPRLDDGPLLSMASLSIQETFTYADLEQAAGTLGGAELVKALDQIARGEVCLSEQDHASATYTTTFSRADSEIDWTLPAMQVSAAIRAWNPDIVGWNWLQHGATRRRVKLWQSRLVEASLPAPELKPGELQQWGKQRLLCGCGDGCLELLELQPESGKRMQAASFIAGGHFSSGDCFAPKSRTAS